MEMEHIRDWLFVTDHVNAIDMMLHNGKIFESYNIGSFNEIRNIDLVRKICGLMSVKLGRGKEEYEKLITFKSDRLGHDSRYAINSNKIINSLGWRPNFDIEKGLSTTIDWYLKNKNWLNNVISKNYLKYYQKQYSK